WHSLAPLSYRPSAPIGHGPDAASLVRLAQASQTLISARARRPRSRAALRHLVHSATMLANSAKPISFEGSDPCSATTSPRRSLTWPRRYAGRHAHDRRLPCEPVGAAPCPPVIRGGHRAC